jgi:L-seryl-tRNA(Ser) seleniumtransferase
MNGDTSPQPEPNPLSERESEGIVSELGVRRVINAAGTLTVLGGSLMPAEVLQAMREAASCFVDVHEFQRAVGERLADLTRNEAAYVTCGCAAAISVAVLACITGGDPALISRMPAGRGLRREIVMHRSHRIPYDPAVRLVGGRIVEVGNVIQTFPWEFEAAINERTAAVLYVAGSHLDSGVLTLQDVVDVAHAKNVPVIVDAAAQLPPQSNLWYFTEEVGADLAFFSGGKGLRGPQASGLMVGRRELIEACRENGPPHQRLVRSMKVGKEEMAGLLRAVELYVERDHEADSRHYEAVCEQWIAGLNQNPNLNAVRSWPNEAGQPIPRVLVQTRGSTDARQIHQRLWDGDPRIAAELADAHRFFITPDTLNPGEERVVMERILDAVREVG